MPEQSERRKIPMGFAFEQARRRVGYTVEGAARELRITDWDLSRFESGIRIPPQYLVDHMAELYGVEPDRFAAKPFVPVIPPKYYEETSTLWLGWTPIVVEPRNNDQLIRVISAAIRSMRSLAEEEPVSLREAELAIVASLLDLGDSELPQILMGFLRINEADAAELVEKMHAAPDPELEPAPTT